MAKILIVDDSIIMRKNLEFILKNSNHQIVGQATNGKQAVELYKEYKPDLVTMDISMPFMSGTDAVSEIISIDSSAKIIMISAINQKQLVFEAIKKGAKHYIVKPIDAENVIKTIDSLLNDNLK